MKRVQQRETIVKGVKYDYERVTLLDGKGRTLQREIVRHPGAVVIVPILQPSAGARPELVLIRNQRFTVDEELWEFPAGTMEPPEPPDACAGRELEEEAGYRATTITTLGMFYTTPGMTDERMHAFAATGLTHVGQQLMDDEEIRVEVLPVPEVLRMIDAGEFRDAKSLLALWLAIRRGVVKEK